MSSHLPTARPSATEQPAAPRWLSFLGAGLVLGGIVLLILNPELSALIALLSGGLFLYLGRGTAPESAAAQSTERRDAER